MLMSILPKVPSDMSIICKASLKQHFTDAQELNKLMCQLLGSVEDLSLLEPSVGHGAFLANLDGVPSAVHVVDIDPDAIATTTSRFSRLNLVPHRADFIDIFLDDMFSRRHPIFDTEFDAVISNPPFGLYLEREYRARLKRAFPTLYVRESYGLFFVFSVSLLRNNGRYVFLLPDTFLTSRNHTPLRQFIAAQAAPTTIVRFAPKRFETVNFGYGNLCIIAGHRRPLAAQDKIVWLDAFEPSMPLSLDALDRAKAIPATQFQSTIGGGWSPPAISRSRKNDRNWPVLGDLAECRTGIYTGDNVRFIGYDPRRVKRRLNGHPIEWNQSVIKRDLTTDEMGHGVDGSEHYVPLIRGGHRDAFEPPYSAIDWRPGALHYYRDDKKARFQNSVFYFRSGISVPMVATKRISAALMDGAVFDQGVVGIFPNKEEHTAPLLLYLNSRKASDAIKAIVNGSANNSANYMKRLPVPPLDAGASKRAKKIVAAARSNGRLKPETCDEFVAELIAKSPRKISR